MQHWECAFLWTVAYGFPDTSKQYRGMLIWALLTCQGVTMMDSVPRNTPLWCIDGRQDSRQVPSGPAGFKRLCKGTGYTIA